MTTLTMRLDHAAAALVAVALFAGYAGPAPAASAAPPVSAVNTNNGVALKGYDPVAYFTTGQPTPGLDQYAYRHNGATYRFRSAENRDRFQASPDAYAPQYGGYCAHAMSINRIADIDPARWAIVDGKLYLNKNRLAHTLWSVNKSGHIADGDQHWAAFPKVIEAQ